MRETTGRLWRVATSIRVFPGNTKFLLSALFRNLTSFGVLQRRRDYSGYGGKSPRGRGGVFDVGEVRIYGAFWNGGRASGDAPTVGVFVLAGFESRFFKARR